MGIVLQKRLNLGFTLVELLSSISLIGLMFVCGIIQVPILAKIRADRIRCTNNLKLVGNAFKGFANANNGCYPWILTEAGQLASGLGNGAAYETRTLFAQPAIKVALGTSKVLVSPLDPERQKVNNEVDYQTVSVRFGGVPNAAHSYGLGVGCRAGQGADSIRPATIISMTRNISGPINNGDSLSTKIGNVPEPLNVIAHWKGSDRHPLHPRRMTGLPGLNVGAGQLGLADGSAGQSSDIDLFRSVRFHHNQLGGNYKGSPSGIIDTPND